MELIQKEFEKFVLGIALLGFIFAAALASIWCDNQIARIPPIRVPDLREPGPLSIGRIDTKPRIWEGGLKLFGSIERVFKDGVLVPRDQTNAPGFSVEFCVWLQQHNLECTAGIEKEDEDGDKWTNGEEWKFSTDPNDAQSFPTPDRVLRLEKMVRGEFPLRFKGRILSPDGKQTFQINVRDLEYTYLVGLNERIASDQRSEEYRVVKFVESSNVVVDPTLSGPVIVDTSQLTLQRITDSKEITLTYGQIAHDSEWKAVFRNTIDGSVLPVRPGDAIEIRGRTYKMILREGQALLTDSNDRAFSISPVGQN